MPRPEGLLVPLPSLSESSSRLSRTSRSRLNSHEAPSLSYHRQLSVVRTFLGGNLVSAYLSPQDDAEAQQLSFAYSFECLYPGCSQFGCLQTASLSVTAAQEWLSGPDPGHKCSICGVSRAIDRTERGRLLYSLSLQQSGRAERPILQAFLSAKA